MNLMERMFGTARRGEGAQARALLPEPDGGEARKADIEKWWTYYHGTHPATGKTAWDYLYERFEGMPRRELADMENHTRICTDRLRRLLVNTWRGFEFDDESTGAKVREALARNRWPHLLNLAVLTGKVTGDAFVKLAPSGADSRFGPVRFVLLDSGAVTVETPPHDRDDIRTVTVAYRYMEEDGEGRRMRSYREVIDSRCVTAFVDGEFAPDYSYDHKLGFIPVVHIRNLDTGGGVYGESLVARLVEAQDALNLLSTDLMDIVRYDGHKTTIFQNVQIDRAASRDGRTPGEVDLSIGKGLAVKGEGKVYKLDQQHDLGAALEEYDRKLDAFYDLAGVPRIGRDLAARLGNLSGRAIERLYRDAVDSTIEAQGLYGESFRELAGKTAAMLGLPLSTVRVHWNADVIAADVDTLKKEYEMGARSLRSVMLGLGIEDPEAMTAEVRKEKETRVRSQESGE